MNSKISISMLILVNLRLLETASFWSNYTVFTLPSITPQPSWAIFIIRKLYRTWARMQEVNSSTVALSFDCASGDWLCCESTLRCIFFRAKLSSSYPLALIVFSSGRVHSLPTPILVVCTSFWTLTIFIGIETSSILSFLL
jgi:hypothetical protein